METEGTSPTGAIASTSNSDLSHSDLLRFEHALLLSEKRFLETELQASPGVYARMTTSRLSNATEEARLLKMYVEALANHDTAACKVLDEKMRSKVAEMRRKAALLEKMLRGVRKEVRFVLDHSASTAPESATANC